MRERRGERFRPDVEGLRAIAVLGVLLCHSGLPLAAGGYVGVDVFFVISGYLITRLLLSELDDRGGISLLRFYARRARRLLPLAFGVLAAVSLLSAWLLTPLENERTGRDVIAAGASVVNWRLRAQSVDYFESDVVPSPVQHYWSLSVEEQFYLAWPAVLLIGTWWARRRGRDLRRALWPPLVVLAAGSLLVASTGDTDGAYFSTVARGWELALGGLLALVPAGHGRVPRPAASALAWGGLVAIVVAYGSFDSHSGIPGPPALLPTLGTVAVLAGGALDGRTSAARLLARRPLRHVGRVSYSWYLWHWPLLVLAAARWGEPSVAAGLAIVTAAWVPSVLSHVLLERPLHRSGALARRPRASLALGTLCGGGAVASGLLLLATQPAEPTIPLAEVSGAEAASATSRPQRSARGVRPAPRDADGDRGRAHRDGCLVPMPGTRSPDCVYGDPRGARTVVVFGDSHAAQYVPALDVVAQRRHWRLVVLTKAGCTAASGVVTFSAQLDRRYDECMSWRRRTLRRIVRRERPDLVVVGSSIFSYVVRDGRSLDRPRSRPYVERGYERTLRRLGRTGARVAVLRDGPRAPKDVPTCVSGALHRLERCAFPLRGAFDPDAPETVAARRVPGVRLIDTHALLCPGGTCPAVMGNALVYRDRTHLTATFARTAHRWLGRRLPARLPRAAGRHAVDG